MRSDAINAIENTLRYSSDEELGKAALHELVFRGTPLRAPERGHGRGLARRSRSTTCARSTAATTRAPTRCSASAAASTQRVVAQLEAAVRQLPAGARSARRRRSTPQPIEGRSVVVHRQAGRRRLDQLRLSARRAPRRARLLRAVDRELVARRAPQSVEPSVQRDPRAARAELRRLLVHRGVPRGRRAHHAARQRAAPHAALRDLDPHAAERAGAVRAARGAARARSCSSTTA